MSDFNACLQVLFSQICLAATWLSVTCTWQVVLPRFKVLKISFDLTFQAILFFLQVDFAWLFSLYFTHIWQLIHHLLSLIFTDFVCFWSSFCQAIIFQAISLVGESLIAITRQVSQSSAPQQNRLLRTLVITTSHVKSPTYHTTNLQASLTS